MNDKKVNKVIAYYMGYTWSSDENEYFDSDVPIKLFTESLDAQVPVWVKLGIHSIDIMMDESTEWKYASAIRCRGYDFKQGSTAARSMANSLANLIIKELKELQ
jgi:energy-coupling factor transporter transmembrane protein EcfT